MKQKTINVRFFLIKNRTLKNGEAPILMRITLDGEYEEVRIQRSVQTDLWDQVHGLSKGKDRNAKELNEYIRALHIKALDIHKELTMEGAYITPSSCFPRF